MERDLTMQEELRKLFGGLVGYTYEKGMLNYKIAMAIATNADIDVAAKAVKDHMDEYEETTSKTIMKYDIDSRFHDFIIKNVKDISIKF